MTCFFDEARSLAHAKFYTRRVPDHWILEYWSFTVLAPQKGLCPMELVLITQTSQHQIMDE
jgi:hypothetical protein